MSVAEAGDRAGSHWRWSQIPLLALLLLVGGLYVDVILNSEVRPDLAVIWFPVLLILVAFLALILRPRAAGVEVMAALLASLSILFQTLTAGLSVNALVAFISLSLILLFPFAFVHFSLIFPAVGQRDNQRIRRIVVLIYLTLAGVLVASGAPLLAGTDYVTVDDIFVVFLFVFVLGFLVGLGIFVRNFFCSLTATEKNRLRVMLIGCLAGGLPVILAIFAGLKDLEYLAQLLLPLFPLSIAVAVLKEDFAEPGPVVQNALRISMVVAGGVSAFYLASFLLSFISSLTDPWRSLVALGASLAAVIPLFRWSGSYVGSHFQLPLMGQWGDKVQSLSTFHPISPNPYIVGNPVRTPEMFFGRAEDFQFIRTKLEGQKQGCVILLCGERRAGKTSILYQILNGRLGPDLLPVFVDMQELVVQNDREFVSGFAARVVRGLKEHQTASASSLASDVEDYLQLTELFEQIMKVIGSRRLLLLFDEYELIGEKVRDGRLSAEVGDYLNSLLERHTRLNMVFAGSRPLDADPTFNRLLGKSSFREISYLALPDAVNLIYSPLEGRVAFENQAISDLLLLTRGHPFFVQLLCQLLVELLNELRRTRVSRELVAEAVTRLLDSPPPQLLYKWSGYRHTEKLVLAGLGTLLKRPGSYLPADRLTRLILSLPANHRKELDSVGIRIILEDLRREGTLDRDQDRYGFTMDLLRRYVQAEHTVWNVLGEKR